MATELLNGAAFGGDDWGDDGDDGLSGGIPPRSTVQNADGTTTITDFSMSEDGYLQKTIKVVRYIEEKHTVSKSIAARKGWAKFGDCKDAGPGLERGISTVSIDEIHMEWIANEDAGDEEEEEMDFSQMAQRDIQSKLKMERFKKRQEERKMGLANWAQLMSMEATEKDPSAGPPPGVGADGGRAATGKYQPPAKRGGSAALSTGESMYSRDDSATVRISNVSRGTTEADLEELCEGFGKIRRIFLSRDRDTGESKGFAFVAYHNVSDAARCIERLHGFGYDHLILQVEWSKPKEPREGEGAQGGGGGPPGGGPSRFGR